MTNRLKTIVLSLLAAGCASCSVKEDRGPCPCWLGIDITGCADAGEVSVSLWNGGHILSEKVSTADYPDIYERTVPKGWVHVSVSSGARRSSREGPLLMIPVGEDADSLWAHAACVPCFGESARDTAVLHKQFARVFMKVENPVGEDYPYVFTVTGGVAGTDLRDLSPVEGTFMRRLSVSGDDRTVFCLPRQKQGAELSIAVERDGVRVDTLPLGAWIGALGYSWSSIDLRDIYIGIDYAEAEVTVSVNGWGDGGSIRVEI